MLLEFNNNDKKYISDIASSFSISVEFELETNDRHGTIDVSENAINIIKNNCKKYINDEYKGNKSKMYSFIENIFDELLFDNQEDIEVIEEYLSEYNENEFEFSLLQLLYADYLTYISSDNIDYLTEMLEKHLPIFFKKWNSVLKFELDNTLNRGIEFSLKKYLIGIDNIVELITDFYSDFKTQEYWYMGSTTGIHINIGPNKPCKWNILKGILMISDSQDNSFTFKDMEWRKNSHYTKSILPEVDRKLSYLKSFSDIEDIEKLYNSYLYDLMKEKGYKNFGFNITRINKLNYVEFRYPGGDMPLDILIDKIYYFCYIVNLMIDSFYKRKDYLKKLYKFIR